MADIGGTADRVRAGSYLRRSPSDLSSDPDHRKSDRCSGKRNPESISENLKRRTCRGHSACCAGGADLYGGAGSAAWAGSMDPSGGLLAAGFFLVLADPGDEISENREYESLRAAEGRRSSSSAPCGCNDRRTGHGASDGRRRGKGRGGDRRGEYFRWNRRAADLSRPGRSCAWLFL